MDKNLKAKTDSEPIVSVQDVTMVFNIANERLNSLKEYFLKLVTRQLFYREFIALDQVSLEVEKGDVYAIVGVNGSGKSTLLKIIAGVLEPSQGKVMVRGRIAPLIELGAGFDFELTARENIYLNGALLGYSRQFIRDNFDEIVGFAEMEEFLELPMKNYSSGMVARVAFAVATVMVPDLLIIDEALSVGDMFFQEKCLERINTLINEHQTTVLFVSHNIDQVERLCKKALWLEKGIVKMNGDVKDVCDAYSSSQE
ncbi:MAG: ABC transporter ATP-binding protein [Coriobacteriia bacterium]|nr:ABC transporter ATP-binding protein [Coriobacteriia bacterium]